MPVTLVGTIVGNRVNFTAVAWMSRVNRTLPMLAVAINKGHYTPEGIQEAKTFSVNIPTVNLLTETDYCGLVSGRNIDKSKIFEVFFGELETAPMIKDCPICAECKLFDIYKQLPTNFILIGEIIAVYSEEKYLAEGAPDIKKINPIILAMAERKYVVLGNNVGDSWKDGQKHKN